MAAFYGAYLQEHGGQPPPDEQAFRDFLAAKQPELETAGLSVDDMFISPRSPSSIQWIYGGALPVGPSGMEYFAYEQQPIDNARLVIASRGIFDLMDESRFHEVFPNAPRAP